MQDWTDAYACVCGSSFHPASAVFTLLCAMEKEVHVTQESDLIEQMRETLSSPEFFATLSGVDRVMRDPISLVGLESTSDQKPEVVNGDGGLGHREEDVNRKDAQPFGPQEQGVTQKDALPVGTQGPGIEQKDALPFGSQEQSAGRDGGDGLQVPGFKAVLPAKRSFRSLAMLSSELTENKHRKQGLHPNPFGVAPKPFWSCWTHRNRKRS